MDESKKIFKASFRLLPLSHGDWIPEALLARGRPSTFSPLARVLTTDMRKRQRGVTIIEMMVVVTIIALFSGVVGVRYFTYLDHSRRVAATSQLAAFNTAIAGFYADVARYPSAEEGLTALRQAPASVAATWRGPYLNNELPFDPWGNPYIYEITKSGEPRVSSLGADGLPGGDGKNADVVSLK